ncbi:uncharacterized protein LOC106866769 isoform X2 [Brachypodium distachyon]|uniref:uncharacterized protein LOC106866769 isoform X2 n=1 Tax=Brachypodium distachyon TaxID=15368 RepID=UPI00071C38C0|nr:uncharacterized protein LOC106866769 isoform X2 [Brachypodium distachyon]|eukprot:XP_014758052.1 uncharacterized protein LOC106866769 isoform X2 [Brachypodium distachyon]
MAGGCYGRRRLSELLQEQQEPFLFLLPLHGHGGGEAPCCSALGRAARRALRPGYGCFPCGRREKFRRLPRGGDNGGPSDDDDELGGGDGARQQLSPVSVLDVLQYDSDSDEGRMMMTMRRGQRRQGARHRRPSSAKTSRPPRPSRAKPWPRWWSSSCRPGQQGGNGGGGSVSGKKTKKRARRRRRRG